MVAAGPVPGWGRSVGGHEAAAGGAPSVEQVAAPSGPSAQVCGGGSQGSGSSHDAAPLSARMAPAARRTGDMAPARGGQPTEGCQAGSAKRGGNLINLHLLTFVPRGATVRQVLRKHYASVSLKLASLRTSVVQPPPVTPWYSPRAGTFFRQCEEYNCPSREVRAPAQPVPMGLEAGTPRGAKCPSLGVRAVRI